ncbi:acyltransferase 3 [Xylariaceae sp. FL1272]|nr:acyltransferase 3 [Xylariaceae sp. FL1272]
MYVTDSSKKEDEEALLSSEKQNFEESKWSPGFGPLSLRRCLGQTLSFMRPSFMIRATPAGEGASKKKNTTEYLDGVRGVASLIVFILHWSHIPFPAVNSGWGYKNNTSLWLLPFIRLIFSGAAMVSIFFVVSGFVLTHRYIQRMHRHEYNELFSSLTSLTFRRAIRLFLPAFVSSLMAYICACLGIISVPNKVGGEPFEHSFGAYIDYLDGESNPWDWTANFYGFYNPQLWSISVEFRGSMVVFLMTLGLAKSRTSVRMAVETLLTAHCFLHKRWDIALFIAGMLLAELEVLVSKSGTRQKSRWVNVLLVVTLVVGLFLTGYPRDHSTSTPGYMWSKYTWPYTAYRRRYWLAIGAILTVGPMVFMPSIQNIFLTRPAKYLGRISFALYLVHGLGNRTFGKWILLACWKYIGEEGFWPYTISFIVSTSLYFPIVFWASDIFWRAVDVPSTNFARWVEKQCAATDS